MNLIISTAADQDAGDRKRRKKSRWGGGDFEKTFIPGMPTSIPQNLTKDQEEMYLRKFVYLNQNTPVSLEVSFNY